MMRSLFSGVAGIKVHQTRMDVIGNNIANINTIGFKSSRTTFSDMLSQVQRGASAPTTALGGINPRQIGLGVDVESIDLIFSDASPQQTGKNTDLALAGNGLFVLKNGDQSYYTRNGAFMFDEQGYYVMPGSGLRVQGWNASSEGVINTNGLATDVVVPVGKTMNATATTAINYSGNLNASSLTITKISYTTALGGDASKVTTPLYSTEIAYNGTVIGTAYGRTEYTDGDSVDLTVASYTTRQSVAAGTSAPTTVYDVTLKDSMGNIVGVATDVTAQPTIGATFTTSITANADSKSSGVYSVNVDEDNVLSAIITLSDGSTQTVTSGYYEVGKSIPVTTLATVYDSEGGKHEVTLLIDKDGSTVDNDADASAIATAKVYDDAGNEITTVQTISANREDTTDPDKITSYSYSYIDANGVTQTATAALGQVTFENRWRMYIVPQKGELGPAALTDNDDTTTFNNTFTQTESDGSTAAGTMNDGDITFLYFDSRGQFVSNGRGTDPSIAFSYYDGNGASPNTATIDLTGLSQYANNTTSFPTSNGNAAGTLQSLAIDGNGVVTGTYTNGKIRSEAQLAIAQFTNTGGLTKVGTTIYQESNNSGQANIKTVADFGLNVIASALEMSNVDLANEFSDMIITQRGFQANSKMATVSDEMLETLVNMKR
ncbi:MAG: flagellar hook-basal body complex protein [Selenomonadaceae bacterium]|nr:flagellar hook-basal body complex protein [Selenomonadaceae bacterium]MBQ6132379.1 flagellar hook-basal body complex protein [Selenomonadaceae bacterium]